MKKEKRTHTPGKPEKDEQGKIHRPVGRHKHLSKPGSSGVPAGGGSRQGNIGHQISDQSDNSHR